MRPLRCFVPRHNARRSCAQRNRQDRTSLKLPAALALLTVCACGGPLGNLNDAISARSVPPSAGDSHPIRHVVLMIQENRSFDNLFATFPGAEGSTQGKTSDGRTIKLRAADLSEPCDFGHSWQGFLRDYDAGAMDGFDLETGSRGCSGRGSERRRISSSNRQRSNRTGTWRADTC